MKYLITLLLLFPILIFPQDLIITTEKTFEDTTIILNGDLIIQDGGGLTLNSATIQMNCQYEGQYKVRVKSSASFLRLNNSELTAVNNNYPFSFACRSQEFRMINSKLSGVGWRDSRDEVNDIGNGNKGPLIKSPITVIDSSEIFDNFVGLILATDSASVTNCSIHSFTVYALLLKNAESTLIKNNLFDKDEETVAVIELAGGSGNQILNNHSDVNSHGIRLQGSHNNLIDGNEFNGYGVGVLMLWSCNENTISNNVIKSGEMAIQVWGWDNKVMNNTLSHYQGLAGDPINLVNAYNTEVINNRIIGFVNSGSAGIWLRHSSNNLIKGNEIQAQPPDQDHKNTKGIFLTESSSHNIIHSNQINGSVRGIIVSYSSNDNKIYNNNLSEITYQGFLFDNADNNIIYSNNALSNVGRPSFDDGNNTWNYSGPEPLLTLASKPTFDNIYNEIISDHVVIENQTINFESVGIEPGGSLTLRNVTLITGVGTSISAIEYGQDATLIIENSKILHHEYGNGFTMDVQSGGTFIMNNSEVKGAGHEWWYRGIFIMTDDFDIENCTFYEASIIFLGCNGGRFVGNKVYNTFSSILF